MNKILFILFILLSFTTVYSSEFKRDINSGNKKFEEKKYEKAMEKYRDAGLKKPSDPILSYNMGNTFFKEKEWEKAINMYKQAIANADEDQKELIGESFYNIGNAYLNMEDKTKEALQNYINALNFIPDDKDLKHNIELLLRQMQRQKQQQQQQQKQDENNKNKDENQDKEQQNQAKKDDNKKNDKDKENKQDQNQQQKKNNDKQQEQKQKQAKKKEDKEEDSDKKQALMILQALQDQERKTQKDVLDKEIKNPGIKTDKDW